MHNTSLKVSLYIRSVWNYELLPVSALRSVPPDINILLLSYKIHYFARGLNRLQKVGGTVVSASASRGRSGILVAAGRMEMLVCCRFVYRSMFHLVGFTKSIVVAQERSIFLSYSRRHLNFLWIIRWWVVSTIFNRSILQSVSIFLRHRVLLAVVEDTLEAYTYDSRGGALFSSK